MPNNSIPDFYRLKVIMSDEVREIYPAKYFRDFEEVSKYLITNKSSFEHFYVDSVIIEPIWLFYEENEGDYIV